MAELNNSEQPTPVYVDQAPTTPTPEPFIHNGVEPTQTMRTTIGTYDKAHAEAVARLIKAYGPGSGTKPTTQAPEATPTTLISEVTPPKSSWADRLKSIFGKK